jgi:hypothetical protein
MNEAATAGVTVRSKKAIWLVGAEEEAITGRKLPSNRQVLSLFFHHHKTLKHTIRDSARTVVREAVEFWKSALIPVRPEHHAITKLEQMHHKWVMLKKHSSRATDTQQANEANFVNELDDLFDIAHLNALEMIKIPEDRQFLIAQREKGRRGFLGNIDKDFAEKEAKRLKRMKTIIAHTQNQEQQLEAINDTVVLESGSDSDDGDAQEDVEDDEDFPEVDLLHDGASNKRKRTKVNIVSHEVASALDRTKLSDRKATFLLAATAQSLGHNIDELNISRSSIRRRREMVRMDHAQNVKEQFKGSASLVVHWDGKLLPDLCGKELVDRLPVIVSGVGVNQLLGVPKLGSGTGEAQASAVAQLLSEWGLVDRVGGMCFDTTASNTGRRNGACVLLEQKLDKDMLHFACRHHIFEVVLGGVFKESLGMSSGPDIAIFKRFQQNWQFIDQRNYETGASLAATASCKYRVIAFAECQLKLCQPRDDYREFLELAIIFLGGIPPRGVHFCAPGVMHHARWMAKALYTFKIWMFRSQFSLTGREEKGLRDVCLFLITVYLEAWFTAPVAAAALVTILNSFSA